jgi:hypothetical protein
MNEAVIDLCSEASSELSVVRNTNTEILNGRIAQVHNEDSSDLSPLSDI